MLENTKISGKKSITKPTVAVIGNKFLVNNKIKVFEVF
jgi:hypothetical protein